MNHHDVAPTGSSDRPSASVVFLSVQYLRALAAFMVLLYHVAATFRFIADGPVRPHWLSAGVDVFFLISGFVMVVATERRHVSGTRFLKERIARVVPLYWLVTAVFIAILAAQGRAVPAIDEVAKSLLFVFYTNPVSHEPTPIVTAGWTLNYEMVFYLLFAALLRVSVPGRIAAMTAIFLCLCAARSMVPHDDAFLFRMTSPQPLEFVAGMLLGHVRHRLLRLPAWTGIASMAAGFAGLALVDSPFTRVVHFAPCATAIMVGAIVCERYVRSEVAALRLLGDSSYSLYLTHPLVLELLPEPGGAIVPRVAGALLTIVACVIVSLVFYRSFERPAIRFFRRRLKGHPTLAVAA